MRNIAHSYPWMTYRWLDASVNDATEATVMKITATRHAKPHFNFMRRTIRPVGAAGTTFTTVQVHPSLSYNVIVPATWTLCYTRTNLSKKKIIEQDVKVHLLPYCCGMTNSSPLLVHSIFIGNMRWCTHCVASEGSIFTVR